MSKEVELIKTWYKRCSSARGEIYKSRKKWEEFYYNDVEQTLSQFSKSQADFIDKAYKIPISTKLSYPIIEVLISMLTGSKPMPRITTPSFEDTQFAEIFGKAYHGVWYESHADNELRKAIQDAFVVGSGFIRVRRNNFFNESTFNVMIEHVPWKHVFVDPFSQKADFSDAQYVFIARGMVKAQAEKEYDVKITKDTGTDYIYNVPIDDDDYWSDYDGYGTELDKNNKYISIIEGFIKEEKSIYISENGDVSMHRPKQIMLPNPEKEVLAQKLQQHMQEMEQTENQGMQMADVQGQNEAEINGEGMQTPEQFTAAQGNQQAIQQGVQQTAEVAQDQMKEFEALKRAYMQMPDEVPGFEMIVDDLTIDPETKTKKKSTVKVYQATRVKRKFIKRVLIVGSHLLEKEYLKTDMFPIHHLSFQHNLSPNRTYGTIHYIYDLVNAQNKFWSMLIYDMQVNNNRRVLYAQGTITNIEEVQKAWSLNNAWIKWHPNPSLPDAGRPYVSEAAPLNQANVYIIDALRQLIEYVTGIHSTMQGNPAEMPNTLGGIQSLQNLGSQRPQLYARTLETLLENLSYSAISFLQAYGPKDKILSFFDLDGNPEEVQLLEDTENTTFKVRVDIINSLPTHKQLYAQMLTSVAGQTKNQSVADALTQTALTVMDMPEGKKLAKDIDVINNLQQQLQQAAQKIDELTKQNKIIENNMIQKEIAHKIDLEATRAKNDIEKERVSTQKDIQHEGEAAKEEQAPSEGPTPEEENVPEPFI